MTTADGTRVEAAVRAGCNEAGMHLACAYPKCACKQTPVIVRAALLAADAASPASDEAERLRRVYSEFRASPASGNLAARRKESWINYNSNHQGEDAKFAYDAGFDAGVVAAIMAGPASPASGGEIETIKNRIDSRLNDCLCEMKPDYDDSIVGFNEAWDIVRKTFADAMASASPAPAVTEEWQAIETAPRNSAWVWTFTPSRVPQQTVMRWMPGATLKQSKWETSDRQWYVFGPTHWRPLPAPPTMIRGDRD